MLVLFIRVFNTHSRAGEKHQRGLKAMKREKVGWTFPFQVGTVILGWKFKLTSFFTSLNFFTLKLHFVDTQFSFFPP